MSIYGPVADYFFRPRINALLEEALYCPLVIAVAGVGYGKTQAVRQFARRQEQAVSWWVALGERDNDCLVFWEDFICGLEGKSPEFAKELHALGFPETNPEFERFVESARREAERNIQLIVVFDNAHLIENEKILAFIARSIQLRFLNSCTFFLCRREPALKVSALLSEIEVRFLNEEDFRFTEKELQEFLASENVRISSLTLSDIYSQTGGWPLAVNYLCLALERAPDREEEALYFMKQKVFVLMEREAFSGFSEEIRKNLIKLSLISQFPLLFLRTLEDSCKSFLNASSEISSFLRYDVLLGYYHVHPVYLEFLASRQHLLTEDEKSEVYLWAAKWCMENKLLLYELEYRAKLKDYWRMLEICMSYPVFLSTSTAKSLLRVLEGLPSPDCDEIGACALLKYTFLPRIFLELNRYAEAEEMGIEAVKHWEQSSQPFAEVLLYSCYNALGYIKMYAALKTHQYDFDQYYQKGREVFQKNPVPSYLSGGLSSGSVSSFICFVGIGAKPGEFDSFLRALRSMEGCLAQILPGFYHGGGDLAEAEIAFYRSDLTRASLCAQQAVSKARSESQYGVEALAFFYLLRVAMAEGNESQVDKLLTQLVERVGSPEFVNGHLFYDILTAWFYAQIHLPGLIPPWILARSAKGRSSSPIFLWELIIQVLCLFVLKRYQEALTLLQINRELEKERPFLIGALIYSLLSAMVRQKIGDLTGAVADFEEAYGHSQKGSLDMPFLEMGGATCDLVKLVLKQGSSRIPEQWLKIIDLRAAAYAKKVRLMRAVFQKKYGMENDEKLSEREIQLLSDLYHGLSRQEIAATRYLSVNTVKTELQVLYQKLDVTSSMGAVRVALEHGWL